MTTTDSKCSVRVEKQLSRTFEINSGVRQGDALSPILFNLALEYVFRLSNRPLNNIIYIKSTQPLAYADDDVELGRSAVAVKEQFINLEQAALEIGLRVNESKSFYMSTRVGMRRDLQCGDTNFEGVTSFKYLGSIVTSNNSVEDDIKARIAAGNRVFFSFQPLFRCRDLSRDTKLRMYKSLVRPVVMFGSET